MPPTSLTNNQEVDQPRLKIEGTLVQHAHIVSYSEFQRRNESAVIRPKPKLIRNSRVEDKPCRRPRRCQLFFEVVDHAGDLLRVDYDNSLNHLEKYNLKKKAIRLTKNHDSRWSGKVVA